MTNKDFSTTHNFNAPLFVKRVLIGAAIALIVILSFVLRVGEHDPAWGKYWIIRPLIITPLAGAMGGVFYSLMDTFRNQGGWKKILANISGVVVYIIGLWLGIVLGLAGTLWN